MKLRVISPTGNLFEGEVQRVLLPGAAAPFVVLRGHAPLISSLIAGKVSYIAADGKDGEVAIEGGFVEVRDNNIVVCTE